MTPEEKAKELIRRFKSIEAYGQDELTFPDEHAKSCALICVDEILKSGERFVKGDIIYWQQVYQAITKH